MSEIRIVETFDGEGIQVFPSNNVDSVYLEDGSTTLRNKLLEIDSSIKIIDEKVNSINPSNDEKLQNTISSLENDLSTLNEKYKNLEEDLIDISRYTDDINNDLEYVKNNTNYFEWYNIHLKKVNNKTNKNTDIYTVIENFNEKLTNSNLYQIVFMKRSKKKESGNEWRVPFFNKNSSKNRYYFNEQGGKLITPLGNWSITGKRTENISITDLPCIKTKTKKNIRQYKYHLFPNNDKEGYHHIKNTTYIFKNSSNKKIHLGYAIFKYEKNRWNRVSNIAKLDLYAFDDSEKMNDKYFYINII